MTKKHKRNRAPRASKKQKKTVAKRVSAALSRFLKKQNPAFKKASGVRVQKLKGGVIKFTPVGNPSSKRQARVIRGGANYWIVKREIKGGSFGGTIQQPDIVASSKKQAQEIARRFKSE